MNNAEFLTISNELRAQWGENHYSHAQIVTLGEIVRPLSAQEFRKVLDELAMSCTRAPSIAQIKGAALPLLQRYEDQERHRRLSAAKAGSCQFCGGSGWVQIYRDEDPLTHCAVICTCPAPAAIGIRPGICKFQKDVVTRCWTGELLEQGWHRIEQNMPSRERYAAAYKSWRADQEAKGYIKPRVAPGTGLVADAIASGSLPTGPGWVPSPEPAPPPEAQPERFVAEMDLADDVPF